MQISLKTTKPGGASQGHHVLSILGHLMSPPKTPTSELWSMELRHHNPTHGPWPNKPLSIALGLASSVKKHHSSFRFVLSTFGLYIPSIIYRMSIVSAHVHGIRTMDQIVGHGIGETPHQENSNDHQCMMKMCMQSAFFPAFRPSPW